MKILRNSLVPLKRIKQNKNIMANNHDQFIAFNDTVRLTSTKETTLTDNRKALRNVIRKYFDDNKPNEIKPKFGSQGSFVMKTIVNPIPQWSNEDNKDLHKYDVDDGVYFIGNETHSQRYGVSTYHEWIYDAVKDHTTKGAVKKNTCVRVLYADGHHIDLPIYYKRKDIVNSIPELAHKGKGWTDSDPKAFADWFNGKVDSKQQLRRIVRYLKAWSDYRHTQSDTKMPSGFMLTILAAENISYNDKDDVAMKETLEKIQKKIDPAFGGRFECWRPTTPKNENLFAEFSDTRRDYFLSQLKSFVTSAQQAIAGTNPKESCMKWQKHFGNRFSCATAKNEDEKAEANTYSEPAIIKNNARSA